MADIPIYRLLRNKYIQCAFTAQDGDGARNYGGRWNSVGVPMVYASDHISTAAWELANKVFMGFDYTKDPDGSPRDNFLKILSDNFSYFSAVIQSEQVVEVGIFIGTKLPSDWFLRIPGVVYRPDIQAIGDRWVQSKSSLAMRVPCSFSRRDAFNYLLNPLHADYPNLETLRKGAWRFDGDIYLPKGK